MIEPVKVTNAAPGTAIAPEYSTMRCASKGSKWLLLMHPAGLFGLYTGAGAFVRLLPSEIYTSSRPRWSRTDPDKLTFLSANTLHAYNAAPDVSITQHIFQEYSSIDDDGEADLSLDGDHRVLRGNHLNGAPEVFVFELSTATKGPVFLQGEPFDGLKITSTNHIVLSKDSGIYLPDVAFGVQKLTNADGHACLAVDLLGEPVLLWTNSNEKPITLPDFPNGVVKIRLSDGHQTGLISFPWSDAVDISMPEGGKVCYVATYGETENSGKIYEVALDGSGSRVLLDGINHAVHLYDGQPKFSVSAEGDRGWYAATDPDGVTVNTWMVKLSSPSPLVVIPPAHVSPFPGFTRVQPGDFHGSDYLLHMHADQTFEEYVQAPK